MSTRIRPRLLLCGLCTLGLLLFATPMRAAEVLFVVDDDNGLTPPAPNGIPDKGSIDLGSDTNEGPNTHPALGVKQRLEALGHTVTVLDERVDVLGTQAAMAGKQLIVISSSVASGNITFAKFGSTPIPIINMEPAAWDSLQMSSMDAVVDNAVTSVNITTAGASSPLGGGFPEGPRELGGGVNLLPANAQAPGATVIAQSADGRAAIIDIPQGGTLNDGSAAAGRRIGYFWNANTVTYNADANTLFDRTVQAAIPEPAGLCAIGAAGVLALGRRRLRR